MKKSEIKIKKKWLKEYGTVCPIWEVQTAKNEVLCKCEDLNYAQLIKQALKSYFSCQQK